MMAMGHAQIGPPYPRIRVSSTASDEVARQHQQMVSALSNVTKHPNAPDSPNLPPGCIVCAWCQKVGMKLFTLKTPNGCKAFCSELCFTQCRRASFKKNKICDWCKHVRHTVNYVDFQDGEQQLQFCSDKCLNQYKMNIFCKETQAHLQMHTHLKESACKMAAGAPANLITPELWLRDCKTNGNSMSPMESVDAAEDINSDGNISAAASPSPLRESPLPPSSPLIPKEKKEHKKEHPPPEKEKNRHSKKSSSKHSSRKQSSESKSHSKPHREKKLNGLAHPTEAPRRSPVQASPPSHLRNNHSINGSLLSPPPTSLSRPPLPPMGLPPRPCPPIPSPLGNLEHNRPPFLHHNMVPPPFQFLAQHQMESFFRSQHGFDHRSKIPPPPPFHLPPWMTPPFPSHPRPPPPPHLPHPPISSSKSPSMSHSSPISKNHHSQQSPVQKESHHSKHRHNSKHASTTNSNSTHPKRASKTDAPLTLPSSLPPVTVMVPFPLFLPIPFPIPIPIPIPPNIMEKYSKPKEPEKSQTNSDSKTNGKSEDYGHKKRKNTSEFPKQKKRRRYSSGNVALADNGKVGGHLLDSASDKLPGSDLTSRNIPTDKYFDSIENLSFRMTNPVAVDFSHGNKIFKTNQPDAESRSYSPLSEASNEEPDRIPSKTNRESDDFSHINFSNFNLSLMRSSPLLLSQSAERQLQMRLQEDIENCKSQSPTNLSMKEKHDIMSSNGVDFKKKHLRDQMSLMT
ncbi:hypothetical protein JTE90_001930 [Oedothorax gibbosus]|uniref:Sine oculis-binding protein homolog n=1 Tax=Oedothorax gibbosus TaxID=931172 RepID=A0AAV6VWG5_9ARAC|nr:hypothetical protein JTE90_001930 [Oedothorax gibbosus]